MCELLFWHSDVGFRLANSSDPEDSWAHTAYIADLASFSPSSLLLASSSLSTHPSTSLLLLLLFLRQCKQQIWLWSCLARRKLIQNYWPWIGGCQASCHFYHSKLSAPTAVDRRAVDHKLVFTHLCNSHEPHKTLGSFGLKSCRIQLSITIDLVSLSRAEPPVTLLRMITVRLIPRIRRTRRTLRQVLPMVTYRPSGAFSNNGTSSADQLVTGES